MTSGPSEIEELIHNIEHLTDAEARENAIALVQALMEFHVAVVIQDDPGRDFGMMRQPGHRFFFSTTEVEPLAESNSMGNL